MTYSPGVIISEKDPELAVMIAQELAEIAKAFAAVDNIVLKTLHEEPVKPREGMIVLADGTNWNPIAAGGGYYGYYGSAWVKLG